MQFNEDIMSPSQKNWHFNDLIGRCERSTQSFCGGKGNTFSEFKECQRLCEEEEIVTTADCRMVLERREMTVKPKKGKEQPIRKTGRSR
uniref:Putative salivary kunitz domain protein n=1 Tax=Ixodes ricinus TaxID=34613 RepID=A0A0K8R5K5_IXORI